MWCVHRKWTILLVRRKEVDVIMQEYNASTWKEDAGSEGGVRR